METIISYADIFLIGSALLVSSAGLLMASLALTRASQALKLAKSYEGTIETLAKTINQMKMHLGNAAQQEYPPPRQEKVRHK